MLNVRWKAGAFLIVAALLLAGGAEWIHDTLFYPWARATPPLLDEWAGQLTTGNGERLAVAFVLKRARASDGSICANCAQIEGTAVTCDARGKVLHYRLSGSPLDRAGSRLRIGVIPQRQPPPDGLEFSAVSGTWDGADALTLQAEFFWRKGGSGISSTDDPATQPVPLLMSRQRSAAISPCAL